MKRISFFLFSACLFLASCSNSNKDLYDPATNTTDDTTSSLTVPSDFSWETMKSVTVNITSPATSTVSIYSDSNCSNLLMSAPVTANVQASSVINIPTSLTQVYVKYPTSADAYKVVPLSINTSSKAVSRTDDETVTIGESLLAGIYTVSYGNDEYRNFVASSEGTVMFEDSWPALADYDMNDLVFDYKVTSHVSIGDELPIGAERIDVNLTIRAIGGVFPEKIGFTFAKNSQYESYDLVQENDIDSYTGLDTKQGKVTVTLANPNQPTSTPIFYISSLRDIATKGYYNTKEYDGGSATVSFSIILKSSKDNQKRNARDMWTAYGCYQDFFVVTTGGKEIHLRGFNPTSLYANYSTDAAASDKLSKTIPYTTSDNHVWGIKIPAGYLYPSEKVDIKDAFTGFAEWIKSGGTTNTDWYKYPVSGKVFTAAN